MLTLTPSAASLIRGLVENARMPPGAGLRIAQHDHRPWLVMQLARSRRAYDTLLFDHGATVFVGRCALQRLHGQTLDAHTGTAGSAFYLRD